MKIIIVVGGGGDGFERDAQAFHVRVVAHLSRADLEARGVEPVAYRAREVVLGARQLARESADGGGGGEGKVLKERRAPRERGRMGSSLTVTTAACPINEDDEKTTKRRV